MVEGKRDGLIIALHSKTYETQFLVAKYLFPQRMELKKISIDLARNISLGIRTLDILLGMMLA
jgi:hypothetical protein